jgi:hypothetical protein
MDINMKCPFCQGSGITPDGYCCAEFKRASEVRITSNISFPDMESVARKTYNLKGFLSSYESFVKHVEKTVMCARCGKAYTKKELHSPLGALQCAISPSTFKKQAALDGYLAGVGGYKEHQAALAAAREICSGCRDEIRARRFFTNKCNRCYVGCSGETFSFLPDGTKVILCAMCSRELFPIYKAHYEKGISLITEGIDDLERGKGFDPENDYIETNLSQARELCTKLNLTHANREGKKSLAKEAFKSQSQRNFLDSPLNFCWVSLIVPIACS